MLTAKEKNMIENYINDYAEGENEEAIAENAPIEERLRFWEQAKREYLYPMFGNQLILEREIEYEAPAEAILNHSDFREKTNKFYDNLFRIMCHTPEFSSLIYHIYPDGSSFYGHLLDRKNLLDNRWKCPTTIMPLPNGKSFQVTPGTRMTRIFGKLAKTWNVEGWEEARQAQADAVTAKTTKGTLCLSIHPMDYLTMSDNAENWDSCMTWVDRGGYRAGTVEMMNSNCVVVAYLKHKTNSFYNWNSKTWRELFVVHPKAIVNIKAYPYKNEWLTKYILSWLKELAEEANLNNYADNTVLYEREHRIRFETGAMYNDFFRTEHYIYLPKNYDNKNYTYIRYSGIRNCMWCGLPEQDYTDESSVICLDCDASPTYRCADCGRVIRSDEICTLDNETYCEDCYSNNMVYTLDDDDYHHIKNCSTALLLLPDGKCSPCNIYVYDIADFAKYTLNMPVSELTINEYGDYQIPYAKATQGIKFEAGLTSDTIARYNEYF